ncbi:conserved hypothetical protein [Ricinus communis]|uniref:Uncharacterized protein n=1 Tax=Ricinus communis TaxID=3988 RepID=B9RWL1_RICCO|nr:conserved hypothetical protein [Ricinus communis]
MIIKSLAFPLYPLGTCPVTMKKQIITISNCNTKAMNIYNTNSQKGNYSNRGEENSNRSNNYSSKKQILEEKEDGVMQELPNNHCDQLQGQEKSNGASSGSNNGPHIIEPFTTAATLKSNLKRTTTAVLEENNQSRKAEKRKVSWPDAHGKDIAHVHEFEPSISEYGELEGGFRTWGKMRLGIQQQSEPENYQNELNVGTIMP